MGRVYDGCDAVTATTTAVVQMRGARSRYIWGFSRFGGNRPGGRQRGPLRPAGGRVIGPRRNNPPIDDSLVAFWSETRSSGLAQPPARGDVAPAARTEDTAGVSQEEYLLASQPSELERLQLQSQVWEPSGRRLLSKIGSGSGGRALDVGCGAMGWLRILGEWVGPSGQVVGTDIDASLLDAARSFLEAEGISNVALMVDDLFDSKLEPRSFDLVHARYLIAPARTRPRAGGLAPAVGQAGWLTGPGGVDWAHHGLAPAPAASDSRSLLSEIFARLGGEAGRGKLPPTAPRTAFQSRGSTHT